MTNEINLIKICLLVDITPPIRGSPGQKPSSVAYFNHVITMFEALIPLTAGLVQTVVTCQLYLHIYVAHVSPALYRNCTLQHFECSNTIEIFKWIMFDFYLVLPHLHTKEVTDFAVIHDFKGANSVTWQCQPIILLTFGLIKCLSDIPLSCSAVHVRARHTSSSLGQWQGMGRVVAGKGREIVERPRPRCPMKILENCS